jgi:Leucine-rich repeat (LRR) protein
VALTTSYLHNNKLGDVPENTLPSMSLLKLGINNCSLQGIPSTLKSLTKLAALYIAENDLSRVSSFSDLPATLETLELRSCRLQAVPGDLKELTKLVAL